MIKEKNWLQISIFHWTCIINSSNLLNWFRLSTRTVPLYNPISHPLSLQFGSNFSFSFIFIHFGALSMLYWQFIWWKNIFGIDKDMEGGETKVNVVAGHSLVKTCSSWLLQEIELQAKSLKPDFREFSFFSLFFFLLIWFFYPITKPTGCLCFYYPNIYV